jgi:hypothetical protein
MADNLFQRRNGSRWLPRMHFGAGAGGGAGMNISPVNFTLKKTKATGGPHHICNRQKRKTASEFVFTI